MIWGRGGAPYPLERASFPAIRYVLTAFAALLAGPFALAQGEGACIETAAASALVADLTEAGYEAVGVCLAGDVALVTYENGVLRYDVRAIQDVTRRAADHLGARRLRLVPTRNGIPLLEQEVYSAGPEVGAASLDVPADLPATSNSPRGKLDVVVHPEVRANFGDFDRPVRLDVSLAPTLEVGVARGLSLTGQVVLPLLTQTGETSGQIRPGIVALHQETRLPLNTFVRASVGRFTRDRYGVDLVASTFVQDGRGALTLRAGRTGFARLDSRTWTYSAVNTTTYAITADYLVLPAYGFGASATHARYLSGESGWRVDLHRSFGEASVAVFGLVAGGEPNLGGRITLPLPIRRHPAPRRVRVRLADRFDVEYRYRRTVAGTPDYAVTPTLWDPLGPVNPALLPYHLQRHRAP